MEHEKDVNAIHNLFYGFSRNLDRTEKYLTLKGKIKKAENEAERKHFEFLLKLFKPWDALED